MFPKCCCVPARRDFDNESAGRRELVAISESQLCANARIQPVAGRKLSRQNPFCLTRYFLGFHILILMEPSASSALLACKIGGTTLASNFHLGEFNR